jgi:hypothetical protein
MFVENTAQSLEPFMGNQAGLQLAALNVLTNQKTTAERRNNKCSKLKQKTVDHT